MVRVDGDKIQELRDNYRKKAEHEIMLATKDNTDLTDKDMEIIRDKFDFEAEQSIQKIIKLGPKRMFKMGLSNDPDGWRSGYTKSPVSKRATQRHKKNKASRKQRRKNNK